MRKKFYNLRNDMKNDIRDALDTRDEEGSKLCANRFTEVLNETQCKIDLIVNSNNNTANSYSKSMQKYAKYTTD